MNPIAALACVFGSLVLSVTLAGSPVQVDDRFVADAPVEVPPTAVPLGAREWNWGGGSCVHAGTVADFRWLDEWELAKWWRKTYSGGESFNGLTAKLAKAGVAYKATAAGDVAVLEECSANRRGAIIFYYPNHSILFCGFVGDRAYVLDNNRINSFIEIPKSTFLKNWKGYGGVAVSPQIGSPPPPLPFLSQS